MHPLSRSCFRTPVSRSTPQVRESLAPSVLSFALVAALFLAGVGAGAQIPGDASGDGTLSPHDAVLVAQHVIEARALEAAELLRADANADGVIDSADVADILERAPSEAATFMIGPEGGTVSVDGGAVEIPAGFLSEVTAVEVSYGRTEPIGSDNLGVTIEISIPMSGVASGGAGIDGAVVEGGGAPAGASVDGAERLPALGPLGVSTVNVFGTVGNYLYIAVYAHAGGRVLWEFPLAVVAVDLRLLSGVLGGELLRYAAEAARAIGASTLHLVIAAGRASEPPPKSLQLRRWDVSSAAPVPLAAGPAPRNLVVLAHGLLANHETWRDFVRGFSGDDGRSADPGLPAHVTQSIGVLVVDHDFLRSSSANGADLDLALNAYVSAHPEIENIAIAGHSTGALVARRAIQAGVAAEHSWVSRVRSTVYLGGPHDGAPVQREVATAAMLGALRSCDRCARTPATSAAYCSICGFTRPESLVVGAEGLADLEQDIGAGVGVAPDASVHLIASSQPAPAGIDNPFRSTDLVLAGPNDGQVLVSASHDTADFGALPAANKVLYLEGELLFTQSGPVHPFGAHVQLWPGASDLPPGSPAPTVDIVRADARYVTLRDRLVGDFHTPGTFEEMVFELPGGVPLHLVKMPQGTFQMGSPQSEVDLGWAYSTEQPQHAVTIGYDHYIGKYEVTQRQWLAVTGNNPAQFQPPAYPQNLDRPLEGVSWNEVKNFIVQLEALGLAGTFRLPSEAEWEHAARGGTQSRFHFGASDCGTFDCTECELSAYAAWCGDGDELAQSVGLELPNPFGLYDTMGGLLEYVEDDYVSHYEGAPTDGSARIEEPRAFYRTIRGGNWYTEASPSRPSYHDGVNPELPIFACGFRLAWTP